MQETVKENQTIESGKERKRERETKRQGDRETGRQSVCLLVCVQAEVRGLLVLGNKILSKTFLIR